MRQLKNLYITGLLLIVSAWGIVFSVILWIPKLLLDLTIYLPLLTSKLAYNITYSIPLALFLLCIFGFNLLFGIGISIIVRWDKLSLQNNKANLTKG